MDTFTPETRSRVMARVRGKDTQPELRLRRILHGMGYRYRLHVAALPGKPDIVFPSRRKIVFMHGCFWHGHSCRAGQKRPASNRIYWDEKLAKNMARDKSNRRQLGKLGWRILVVWECQMRNEARLGRRLVDFLES
ncbi:MAG TPA: very short patch repair endonuclease [Candidatus Hydrogenedentes bacterium]|nr:very short patch repair endonuclease [Candidatus Hydrogenedentota bacterium]HOS04416.1 very short patch repair endonuclease [Candidatus Hydrogenedentota bacterium]